MRLKRKIELLEYENKQLREENEQLYEKIELYSSSKNADLYKILKETIQEYRKIVKELNQYKKEYKQLLGELKHMRKYKNKL